jgi:hypothetical protein
LTDPRHRGIGRWRNSSWRALRAPGSAWSIAEYRRVRKAAKITSRHLVWQLSAATSFVSFITLFLGLVTIGALRAHLGVRTALTCCACTVGHPHAGVLPGTTTLSD